ncbi:MAG: hypothetical protein LBS22_00805 [Puniceicoccales bacterium]|jgi:chromosome segregation ATPase|nr:hypothetical protein [Puniceicoccales bacterium]
MTESTQYTVTVGHNTNVTATTQDLTAEQLEALRELQRTAPGDISISAEGVITITTQKGLELFNNFCRQNNVLDSTSTLMQIEVPAGTTLPLAGLQSASAFCARFGGGETDPSKMSFVELMTLMLMMTYASEEERRRTLAEVKSVGMQIAMEVAVATWETSRDAAEKSYRAEVVQAWGAIASGIASTAMAVGSAFYALKASPHQGQLSENNKKLENNQLLENRAELQKEFDLPNTNPETIDSARAGVNQQIQQKEELIRLNQEKMEMNRDSIAANDRTVADKQIEIDARQTEIDARQTEIDNMPDGSAKQGAVREQLAARQEQFAAEQKQLAARNELTDLKVQNYHLKAANVKTEGDNKKLESELKGLKTQEAKLDHLTEIDRKIQEKGLGPRDSLSKGEIDALKNANAALEAEVAALTAKANSISSLSQSISSIIKGAPDLVAASYKQQAAFLEADARLLDTFRGVIQSQIQSVDSSINSANQNMQKIAGNLKQVLDEIYNIKTSIAHNI